MRIRVHMDSARLFRWHLALLDALEAARHDVCISYSANPEPLPISLTAVFDAEHALMQKHLGRLSTHMDAQAFAKFRSCDEALQPDITLDLASATRITKLPGRVLRPAYDGSYKDYALFQGTSMASASRTVCAQTANGATINATEPCDTARAHSICIRVLPSPVSAHIAARPVYAAHATISCCHSYSDEWISLASTVTPSAGAFARFAAKKS